MPAPLALPLGLAAGSSLAWLAASAPPTTSAGSELRARMAAAYFGVLVLAPAVGLLEAVASPWANLYLGEFPSAVALLVVIAAGAAPIAGERLARARLDRGDTRTPLGLALAGALVTVLGGAIAWGRIEVVTTQTAFARDLGGAALLEHRAGAALALSVLAIFAGYAFAIRALTSPTPDPRRPMRGRGAREHRPLPHSPAPRS